MVKLIGIIAVIALIVFIAVKLNGGSTKEARQTAFMAGLNVGGCLIHLIFLAFGFWLLLSFVGWLFN